MSRRQRVVSRLSEESISSLHAEYRLRGPSAETLFRLEDWYTLASLDPDLALNDIVSEFELVPKKEDLQNNEDRQDAAR